MTEGSGNDMVLPVPTGKEEVIGKKFGKSLILRQFRLPTGKEDDWCLLSTGTVYPTMILAITEDGKIILIRNYRFAVAEAVLEVPGGNPTPGNPDEDPLAVAERELLEETGYAGSGYQILAKDMFFEPAANTAHYHVVLATGCRFKQEPTPDPMEFMRVELYWPQDLFALIMSGGVRDDKTVAAIMMALPHLGYEIKKK